MIDDSDGSPGPGTTRRTGPPPWAWALIGLAAGALLFGGAWWVYEAGRSSGRQDSIASQETTTTEVAELVTATVEPTTTPPSTDPAPPPGASPKPKDPGTPGSDPGTAQNSLIIVKPNLSKLQLAIPDNPHPNSTLDYVLLGSYSKTGPWLSTAFGMGAPGTVYMSIVVTKASGGPITLKWIRTSPPQSTTVLWSTPTSAVGQVGASAEVAAPSGSYMIQVEAPVGAEYKMELWVHQ
jgi:hypothetical protein